METITIPIRGLSPILMNNAASMLAPKPKGAHRQAVPLPEEEAAAGAYRLDTGQLYMPMLAFRSALARAATGRKLGKTSLPGLVVGNVFAEDVPAPLVDDADDPITTYEVDIRRCVLTSTAARPSVIRSRPKVWPWRTDVVFEYDPEAIPDKVVVELLDIAGSSVGVGNFRPEKRGRFGRFAIEE